MYEKRGRSISIMASSRTPPKYQPAVTYRMRKDMIFTRVLPKSIQEFHERQ